MNTTYGIALHQVLHIKTLCIVSVYEKEIKMMKSEKEIKTKKIVVYFLYIF